MYVEYFAHETRFKYKKIMVQTVIQGREEARIKEERPNQSD